eukprot:6659195-Prymnesium_polylepis.1
MRHRSSGLSAAGHARIAGPRSTAKDAQPKHFVCARAVVNCTPPLMDREACVEARVSRFGHAASA